MDVAYHKSLALLIGIGSILFLIAAFLPISKIYMESDPEKKLEIIHEMPRMYNVQQILFIGGSLLAAIGLFLQVIGMKNTAHSIYGMIGASIIVIGALLWSWHTFERILTPEGFVYGKNTSYLFFIYSVLTQFGLALIGVTILSSDLASWLGWMLIIAGILLFVIMVIAHDMPPFAYYLFGLILAVAIYSKAEIW